jgi:hypothetical protein
MGNSNSAQPAEHFQNTCHPGLTDCLYDPSQQTLVMSVRAQESMEPWKKDVDPLMRARHLFLPHKYSN